MFTGEAYKTQETLSETLKQLWNASTTGIPGQDDLGQMSSWYVFSSLGVYPLYPGRSDLVLSSPFFSDAKIGNITIRAHGVSSATTYIQSLTVNGEVSSKSWIDEAHVHQPVHLEFELSHEANRNWGQLPEDRPPSYSVDEDEHLSQQ